MLSFPACWQRRGLGDDTNSSSREYSSHVSARIIVDGGTGTNLPPESDMYRRTGPILKRKSGMYRRTGPILKRKSGMYRRTGPILKRKSGMYRRTGPILKRKSDLHRRTDSFFCENRTCTAGRTLFSANLYETLKRTVVVSNPGSAHVLASLSSPPFEHLSFLTKNA